MVIAPDELNFERTIQSGQVFRWRWRDDGAWLGADGDSWYEVIARGGRFEVTSNADEAAFRSYLSLDVSLAQVLEDAMDAGPELAPCLQSQRGLRVLSPADPEEVFFCFLCTPNNNVERIAKMVRALEEYGEPFEGTPGVRRFPRAERIAEIPEEELRARGFGYRGRSIPIAARALLERGEGWLEDLRQTEYQEAHDELVQVPGIGPKLADCISLFGLRHHEAVPVDTHLWQAACREYFPKWSEASLTGRRYREVGDFFRSRFGKFAGWVHQYLFLDNLTRYRSGRGV